MTTARRWTGEEPGSTRAGQRVRAAGGESVPVPEEPQSGMEPEAWRLPSGEDLISFALATGLAATPLLEPRDGNGTETGVAGARVSSRRKA